MPLKAHRSEPNARAFAPGNIFATAVFATALLAPLTGTLSAKTIAAPPISINGSQSSINALEKDDSIFVPMSGVFDKLGTKVMYKAPSSIVATKNGSELAHMSVGSRAAVVNGSAHTLAVAPFMRNRQVMVPLRFISEAAGASVAYSASPRGVQVTRSVAAAPVAKAPAGAAAATVAAASTDVTAAATAAPVADTQANQSGIPWWVWLLAALVILGTIFAFLRRKKEPLIRTTGVVHGSEPVIKTRH